MNVIEKIFDLMGRRWVIKDRDNKYDYMVRMYCWTNPKKKAAQKKITSGQEYDAEENHSKFNLFIHKFVSSDDPVLHNHPWNWGRIILWGGYWEHLEDGSRTWHGIGSFGWNPAEKYHWVELEPGITPWTLFWHTKRKNRWGFLHNGSWVYWEEYLEKYRKSK